MKKINELFKIVMWVICGILFIISSYSLIINYQHSHFLSKQIKVRELDNNLRALKEDVLKVENYLLEMSENNKLYEPIKNNLSILKAKGAYRLLPGDSLGYSELLELNNYFINSVINEGWISNLKVRNNSKIYENYVEILINNGNYLDKLLLSNTNFHYQINDSITNELEEEYNLIINNYKNYVILILNLCESGGFHD